MAPFVTKWTHGSSASQADALSSGRAMAASGTHAASTERANGEPLACLVVALREGNVLIADKHRELVRLPAAVWPTLSCTFIDDLLANPCRGCRTAKEAEPRAPQLYDDLLTALEVAVLRLNHRQQLVTGCAAEVVRSCRQIHDPIFLRRSPRNEREFSEFITALARLLYDGTNGVTSAADRGTVTPTLPGWCYRDHRSVILHVIVLRNHYLHGLSPNETTAEEHLASAGDVFEIYTSKRVADDRDFAAVRVRMLEAATRLMNQLAAHVPVRDAIAEAILMNPNGDGGDECFSSQIDATNLEQSE
jgi:hypothetical protein